MLAPLCLAVALSATAAPPAGDTALRARLAPLLGTIDRPVTADDWKRLPPGALRVLEALAADPAAPVAHRMLALDGAAVLGSSGRIHARLATDATAPFGVRHAAMRALAAVRPADEALAALTRLLTTDPDQRVRGSAGEALSRRLPGGGCGAVRAQAAREGEEGRAALRRALKGCEGK